MTKKRVAVVVLVALLAPLVLVNATHGRFAYADDDGCVCAVSYTTRTPNPACGESRDRHCDAQFDKILLLPTAVDVNR